LFDVAAGLFCGLLDVNRGAPNVAEYCDAMSFGISFDTFPAAIGAAGTVPDLPPGCPARTLPSAQGCDFLD
jgi:hypothetical protein